MIIYAITNSVNGKRYIGLTQMSLGRRWWHHLATARHGVDTALGNAIRKYGPDAFSITQVVQLMPGYDRKALGDLERVIIQQEGTLAPNGYNMTTGGDSMTKGQKLGRPAAHRGKPWSAARREAHERRMRGEPALIPQKKPRTPKAPKERMDPAVVFAIRSAAAKKMWADNREMMLNGARSPKSPEALTRLRENRANMNQSPEHQQKMLASWENPERRAAAAERMRRRNIEAAQQRRASNG